MGPACARAPALRTMQLWSYAASARRHPRGGALLHALIFLVGAAAGWAGWLALHPRGLAQAPVPDRFNRSPTGARTAAAVAAVPSISAATNGALIIPIKDASGTLREPMVLIPVQARRRPEPNDAPEPDAAPIVSARKDLGTTPLTTNPLVILPPATATGMVVIAGTNSAPTNRVAKGGLGALTTATNGIPAAPIRTGGLGAARGTNVTIGGTGGTSNAAGGSGAVNAADKVLASQVGLVRQGISPGSIDGLLGAQTRAALRAFQQREGLPATGALDDATLGRLATGQPIYTNYVVTAGDLERLLPLGGTWLGKSQQARLDFE